MQLDVGDLHVRYGRVHALRGVTLNVGSGEIVTVLGSNGAGKSSLLKTLMGLQAASRGQLLLGGTDITRWAPSRRVREGLVLVPEGRRIVMSLTVRENLLMGAFARRGIRDFQSDLAEIYDLFPNLAARRDSQASVLSGGEQQMLAIGRALLADPRVIMLDEPSLGLSPRLTAEIFALIQRLNRSRGLSILLIEQNTRKALQIATRAYVLELGRKVIEGTPAELKNSPLLHDAYLGRSAREAAIG